MAGKHKEKDKSRLLATRAKTAEQRRLELTNRRYAGRHEIEIRSVCALSPGFNLFVPREIKFYPDGMEALVNSFSPISGKGMRNCATLVVEGRKQIIEFYYNTKY